MSLKLSTNINEDLDNRVIYIMGDISESSQKEIIEKLIEFSNNSIKPITIIISSYGGNIYNGFGIISTIKMVENDGIKINCILSGTVMSMGVNIFLAVKKENRYIMELSTVMLHRGWSIAFGNHNELKISADELKRIDELADNLVIKELNITKEEYYKKVNTGDWYIPAEEFVEMGGGKIIKSFNDIRSKKEKKYRKQIFKLQNLK